MVYYNQVKRGNKNRKKEHRKMKKTNKITKRTLFCTAWKIAKEGAVKFGGKSRDYFSEALKEAWSRIKALVLVPTWIINKNLGFPLFDKAEKTTVCKRMHETEKAILCRTLYKDEIWVPKSVIISENVIM